MLVHVFTCSCPDVVVRRHLVTRPHSRKRMLWDLFGLILVIWAACLTHLRPAGRPSGKKLVDRVNITRLPGCACSGHICHSHERIRAAWPLCKLHASSGFTDRVRHQYKPSFIDIIADISVCIKAQAKPLSSAWKVDRYRRPDSREPPSKMQRLTLREQSLRPPNADS